MARHALSVEQDAGITVVEARGRLADVLARWADWHLAAAASDPEPFAATPSPAAR